MQLIEFIMFFVLTQKNTTVVSWDNHNPAIEGARTFKILDIEPKTAP